MRQFDDEEWLQHEPDLPLHEAESLSWAQKANVPTPQIIAFDKSGSICGMPAVLMSKLTGAVDLKPQNMNDWVDGLAKALIQIHEVEPEISLGHISHTIIAHH